MLPALHEFRIGDPVRIKPSCPIDFEGTGPLPGDRGEIVSPPRADDVHACFAVRLGRMPTPWFIPRQYLERVGGRARRR